MCAAVAVGSVSAAVGVAQCTLSTPLHFRLLLDVPYREAATAQVSSRSSCATQSSLSVLTLAAAPPTRRFIDEAVDEITYSYTCKVAGLL